LPGIACGPGGSAYLVNLSLHTAAPANLSGVCYGEAASISSIATSLDGTEAFLGSCLYHALSQSYSYDAAIQGPQTSATISADGNVTASYWTFSDGSGNSLGRMARPDILYAYDSFSPGPLSTLIQQLQQPLLNDSGSLYFLASPNLIDIVEVQHGALRMRFSLSETISNAATPMAIDSGGRYLYAITNKGLTIVDLGQAPLSIGSVTPGASSAGAQVRLRGSGFGISTAVTVGGQAAVVNFIDQNTLTITVPNVASGGADVVLTNPDGTIYTLAGGLRIF
jgi:hypothetical protein